MAEQFPQQLPNMDANQEQTARPFEGLSPRDKVEAILADARSPMTMGLILEYAGVQYDALPDEDKEAVNGVFSAPNVQQSTHEKFGQQYQVFPDQQEETFHRLGTSRKVVSGQIANRMWNDLFGEDLPKH